LTEKPSFAAVVFPLSLTSCSFLEALPPTLSAPPSTSLSPAPWPRRPTPPASGYANANCCSYLRHASAARCSSTNASAPAGTTRSRIPTDPDPPF